MKAVDLAQADRSRIGNANPSITIVIPARNEEEDIAETLEACLGLPGPKKEVLVVDDSRDRTPAVVRGFAGRGVELHHRLSNDNGCCGARNEGLRRARGEIVVFLNADARPEKDFLTRVHAHYQQGADYVVVRSQVANQESMWAMLLAVEEATWIEGSPVMEWSEGFSCRTDAARAVGGFPGDYPVAFCRDWRLGRALAEAGYRKVTDLSILVPHRVADRLGPFWKNQVWRGTMVAPSARYLEGRSLPIVGLREVARAGRALVRVALLVPLWKAVRPGRRAGLQLRRVLGLALAGAVREVAFSVGGLKGALRVLRASGMKAGRKGSPNISKVIRGC